MAVYDHRYKGYTGALTATWSRFLVIPRYAFREVFRSRMFLAFYVLCFIPLVLAAATIYLRHNLKFLELFELQAGDFLRITPTFFLGLVTFQGGAAFLITVAVAPALISSDLRNNALPLYLSRPLSRKEYLLGKLTVLVSLLSAVTWIPILLLSGLQGYLKEGWLGDNLRVPPAIVLSSVVWIVTLSLLGLAISAWVRWKPIARLSIFGVFFVSGAVAATVSLLFGRFWEYPWAELLSLGILINRISAHTFAVDLGQGPPVWSLWAALVVVCAICLWLLARKVKAYEVVK